MRRLLLSAAAPLLFGCAIPWQQVKTPSGIFCSDMPIVPANEKPDRPVHRLGPVASAPECRTEAERLQSLRQVACGLKGDAVIEAVNEETKQANGQYLTVSSGTAIQWMAPAAPANAAAPTTSAPASTGNPSPPPSEPGFAAPAASDDHPAAASPSEPPPLLRESTPEKAPTKKKKVK